MRRLVLLMALLMCGSLYAYAGPVGPVEFTFLAWIGGDWTNGYPYFISGKGDPRAVEVVMCDDYFHGAQVGEKWDANITNLGTDPLTDVRFNNIEPDEEDTLKLYHEAGWILLQTQNNSPLDWKEMNYAVWTLFDTAALCDAECHNWLSLANTAYLEGFPDTDFNKVFIITPVDQHDPDPNGMQEFLAIRRDPLQPDGAQTTPEPGTFVLLGTGVLAMFRKKIFS
jgi:PEP-CTERM motif